MFKLVGLATSLLLACGQEGQEAAGGCCGGGWWKALFCHRPCMVIGGAVGLLLLIAAYAGLLLLLRAVAPAVVERCRKSIANHAKRNFLLGAVVLGLWLWGGNAAEGNEIWAGVAFMVLLLLWTIKMFGGAAMAQLIGEKVLALRKGKKDADESRQIIVGLAVVILATATIVPGLLAFAIISCIELGAVISAGIRLG